MAKAKHKYRNRDPSRGEEDLTAAAGPSPDSGNAETTPTKPTKKRKERTSEVSVELRGENPDKVAPIIGYFPSGYALEAEAEAEAKFYKHTKKPNRMQLVVRPNTESPVNFVGTSFSGEATAPQMCTYRLGVFDKATMTLKIVPVAANKIFRLEPRVAGSEEPENETTDLVEAHEETAAEKSAAMRELTLKYSSKKNIKQVKKLDEIRKKQDPEAKQELDQKLASIEINKEALKVVDTNMEARNIPPYDLDATTHEAAYPLDKIILEGEWDYLTDIFGRSKSGAEFTPDMYPSFVCNRIHKLDSIKDDSEKRQLAAMFSYITHLVKFKDRHSMDGVASAKKHRIPNILLHRFSSLFSPTESNRLPDDKRDLLTNYILVLTLYVDKFRSDFSDIAKDLGMNAMVLRPYLEYLGCKLVKEKQVTLATLPLPLKFPEVRMKRRKR